ncbi:MAG: aminotransferase class I/II-fold pyridoxal phosphate-dependent enzyme [Nitrosomonas sp.]|uniref:aminotransferase class I/II-fold pyridoxal phosphate-dependent enzyme n=1 Tax=Nitrosomonas sp. TaxID=42353 RepID=UPI002732B817|nr:aminotransferase class I/II-fold pyridoxal phosphate-dependent enzyme [Nitrosomonas sp.]MDP3664262.1 aminotransferase class I/II-fold pyridoxal phosphate-dependent enzyme [Nitrosomonas sp.]MDZ4106590.1 aminotransferase class I/II-fold pyridoxal phosphate-dependent enzyme [Nitrosomonas sp.]
MTLAKIEPLFQAKLNQLQQQGVRKGDEKIVSGVLPPSDGLGPRYRLQGYNDRAFLRMNSNSYLGLAQHPAVISAETRAVEEFGAGPGAVRFISGTYAPHVELERRLAAFHGREAAMLFSAAYATMVGVLPQLISEQTLVVSDALNHNCIISAIRLAHPAAKAIYKHGDMLELESILSANRDRYQRVCVVTDGIFSMRGDHAPLAELDACCTKYQSDYPEGIVTLVDDSHGIGAIGLSGRGTEEVTGVQADVLVATLGKAFGVNGGYVVASATTIAYLRETAPLYIYSNPITPAEAAAALAALDILESDEGLGLLEKLRHFSQKLRTGLQQLGFETLTGEHPIVPIFIRDTAKTAALVAHLFDHNILATGLNYPVVPQGDQEIRLQVSAEHTEKDLDYLLEVLGCFNN